MFVRYVLLIAGLILLAVLIRFGVGGEIGEGSTLKALIVPFANAYLNTFNSPATAISLCFVMVFAGIGLLLFYWLARLGPVRVDLRDAARELKSVPADGTRANFERIDAIMTRHRSVARGWLLYRATLAARGDRIGSRIPPARYFDMRMLEGAGVRLRFFLGLPNDFVGLGLIFTFMGLVAGLYFASRSMMSADLNVARDALVQLLHAATFKFLTSITGIALSLVINWAQNLLIGRLRAELDEIQFLLEERFPMNADADALMPAASPGVAPVERRRERPAPLEMVRPV